ncbi:MAG: gluconate 2-dehydrogenase subunit 3 family protein, partial [Blastocatellia bacterium]
GAGAAIAVTVVGLDGSALAQSAPQRAPLFFTKEEFALVDELTDLIIPADDHSPGARAAQVASYIDFRLSESFEEQPKTLWREGLRLIEQISREMNGKSFLESAVDDRIALLTRISQNEMKPVKPEEIFFKELKSRTARAYYSSKIGIHPEMEYKGNTSLREFAGYDAT